MNPFVFGDSVIKRGGLFCLWRFSYQEVVVLSLEIQLSRREGWDPINGLIMSNCCGCSKPGHGFPTSQVLVLFYVQWVQLRWEVIARFVDIGKMNEHEYVPFVVITIRSFPHSYLITWFETRVILRLPHVEQELPTLPDHLSSPPVLSGIRVARSFIFCVVLCRSLFVLFSFFVWLYVVFWITVS